MVEYNWVHLLNLLNNKFEVLGLNWCIFILHFFIQHCISQENMVLFPKLQLSGSSSYTIFHTVCVHWKPCISKFTDLKMFLINWGIKLSLVGWGKCYVIYNSLEHRSYVPLKITFPAHTTGFSILEKLNYDTYEFQMPKD